MKAFNIDNLCNSCEPFEADRIEKCTKPNCMYKTQTVWDDKFGIIEGRVVDGKCGYTKVIDGVGADAEIVTNSRGGKQSKSPMAMHLVDPVFLMNWADMEAKNFEYEDEATEETVVDVPDREKHSCYEAVYWIARFMDEGDKRLLQFAFDELEDSELQQVVRIAKVLQYGASRYKANNWRLIPQEEHINHALIHIIAHLAGDTQDEHIDHALCRLMMAYATEKSDGFDYGSYVDVKKVV